ncbi:MAG: glycosyltransferase family 2 protein [Planctomycetes bacterium]|nr:glycosyltransferase family 2 protein [Planctomycetota bacterium]
MSQVFAQKPPLAPPAESGREPFELSLVVPAFDEEPNLRLLYERIVAVFGARPSWELVLVDDGSRDGTGKVMRELALADPRVVAVFFEKNCGQTAALAAGVREARGSRIATLDADLQNDPADLPALLALLEGHDAVVGYRLRRRDTFVRRASSRFANWVRNRISGDRIRDTGCSLKVFRAEALRAIPWFEGMHRFLPTLLRYQGFRVIEAPVGHHPRHAGQSKYGIQNRAWRAFKDLLAVRWMRTRMIRSSVREVLRAR